MTFCEFFNRSKERYGVIEQQKVEEFWSMFLNKITENEILDIVKNCKTKACCDADGIDVGIAKKQQL